MYLRNETEGAVLIQLFFNEDAANAVVSVVIKPDTVVRI